MTANSIALSKRVLQITYGLVFIASGADKFTNLLTRWAQYVSPATLRLFGLPIDQFLYLVGIIEITIGIIILTRFTRVGAYSAMIWLVLIVLNLLSYGTFFDIAVRDIVMAVGAFVLGQLS